MAKGGTREGAGRPRGSISQRASEIFAGAVSAGLTPVEYMLTMMRDETADDKSRAWAAEKAAPYIHPRPAPIARAIVIDLPDTSTLEGIKQALTRITAAVAAGEIAPSEGQSLAAVIEAQRKMLDTDDMLERIEALERATNHGRRAA